MQELNLFSDYLLSMTWPYYLLGILGIIVWGVKTKTRLRLDNIISNLEDNIIKTENNQKTKDLADKVSVQDVIEWSYQDFPLPVIVIGSERKSLWQNKKALAHFSQSFDPSIVLDDSSFLSSGVQEVFVGKKYYQMLMQNLDVLTGQYKLLILIPIGEFQAFPFKQSHVRNRLDKLVGRELNNNIKGEFSFNELIGKVITKVDFLFNAASIPIRMVEKKEAIICQMNDIKLEDSIQNLFYALYTLLKDIKGVKEIIIELDEVNDRVVSQFKILGFGLDGEKLLGPIEILGNKQMRVINIVENLEQTLSSNQGRVNIHKFHEKAGQGTKISLAFHKVSKDYNSELAFIQRFKLPEL